jgi:hypothetical protein
MSRIATVSRAHTVSEKVVMATKNDSLETGARSNSLEVTIAFGAEPSFWDRDNRRARYSATDTFPATARFETAVPGSVMVPVKCFKHASACCTSTATSSAMSLPRATLNSQSGADGPEPARAREESRPASPPRLTQKHHAALCDNKNGGVAYALPGAHT